MCVKIDKIRCIQKQQLNLKLEQSYPTSYTFSRVLKLCSKSQSRREFGMEKRKGGGRGRGRKK